MKKLSYILLFGLLACGTDPQPITQSKERPFVDPIQEQPTLRTTCYFDTWSLLHNAPPGIIPFGSQIMYWVTPSITTQSHKALQYTIKIKNLGSRPVVIKGTLGPMNYIINPNQSISSVKNFEDCSNGSVEHFIQILPTGGTPGDLTNIVISMTTVNAPHSLGSQISNSMVFQ